MGDPEKNTRIADARALWQQARLRQKGFIVNVLIVLSSAIIAITPTIILGVENLADLPTKRLEDMVWLAAGSIATGIVVSIIHLLEFTFSYWKHMPRRRDWWYRLIDVNQETADKYSARFGMLTWPGILLQLVLWIFASYLLILTLVDLSSINPTGS